MLARIIPNVVITSILSTSIVLARDLALGKLGAVRLSVDGDDGPKVLVVKDIEGASC